MLLRSALVSYMLLRNYLATSFGIPSSTTVVSHQRSWQLAAASQSSSSNSDNSSSSGKGFGKQAAATTTSPAKTYGSTAQNPINDLIDVEAAMREFFSTREEWLPLFRGMSAQSCQAQTFLANTVALTDMASLDDDETAASGPWKRLQAIPDHPQDKLVLGTFLDAMHQSLLDIPVTDSIGGQEDENDLQFLEEGRRMLAINRFHVVRTEEPDADDSNNNPEETTTTTSSMEARVERYERLFATCWSELMELRRQDQEHTGSLILFPDVDLSDVRRFCDMNLQRPLEWLGARQDFEVTSLQREHAAIRLLYKLNDIPEIADDQSAYDDDN